MSKRLIVILAALFVVGLACSASAEVQNIKVSGDLLVSGVSRDNFNLLRNSSNSGMTADEETLFMTQTRLRVDADLTDNVGVTIRLINERTWDQETAATTDIDLDLAYVTLKEFLYSPLTLMVGRQEIHIGNDLIIGSNSMTIAPVIPTDLGLRKAFDAIRATLNYDPLIIDAIYIKGDENIVTLGDDIDVIGVNAKYDIDDKTSLQGYVIYAHDDNDTVAAGALPSSDKAVKTYVVGGLATLSPIDNLMASLEVAYQWGNRRVAAGGANHDWSYTAWAFQPMLSYNFDVKYAPNLTLMYTHLTGDWNAIYYNQALNNVAYAIIPFSNIQVFNVKGSIKPADDITLLANYGWYQRSRENLALTAPFANGGAVNYGTYAMRSEKELGSAVDLTATYDYTEDVQFGLTTGMFIPGRAFDGDNGKAVQVVGSMKVTF